MGNTCASKPLGEHEGPPATGSSRQLSVPPEPKPAHERWSSSDSESEQQPSPTAAAEAPPADAAPAPPADAPAAPVTAVTGWGGALESTSPAAGSDWDSDGDGDDGIQPFEAESEDEVMPFEMSPAVQDEQPRAQQQRPRGDRPA